MSDNIPKRRSMNIPTQPTDTDKDQIPLFEEPELERWEWFARSVGFIAYGVLVAWLIWKVVYNLFGG